MFTIMSNIERVLTIKDLRVGALLRLNHQEIVKRIHLRLSMAGYDDVRSTYFPVIQPLGLTPSGISVTELAKMAGITKQGMGQLVTYLVQQGYVEKLPNPEDGRAWMVRMTQKGLEMQRVLYNIGSEVDEELKVDLGSEDIFQLHSLLVRLYSRLSQSES
jgi:DNA-binding MarR family transcriptional regulator